MSGLADEESALEFFCTARSLNAYAELRCAEQSNSYVVSKTPPPSFGRAGRPRRIGFSDLFLWDTAIELELTGFSMTELMGEINPKMLALYQDVRRKKKVSLERTREILPAALEEIGLPWAGEYRKALNGEESIVIDF